jgi:hypothetical protein
MYGVFFGVTILISTVETGCALDATGFRDERAAHGRVHQLSV